jgi:hypothetical protein
MTKIYLFPRTVLGTYQGLGKYIFKGIYEPSRQVAGPLIMRASIPVSLSCIVILVFIPLTELSSRAPLGALSVSQQSSPQINGLSASQVEATDCFPHLG